jgi:hypothetical protein
MSPCVCSGTIRARTARPCAGVPPGRAVGKAGLKGNLIVDAFMERAATPGAKQPAARRVPLGTLPAIPFEIVENVVAHR